MKNEAALNNFEKASLFKDTMSNVSYIINSINKYNELLNSNVVLKIPVDDGHKLFYISKGLIKSKKIFKNPSQMDIEILAEAALTSLEDSFVNMDEKSLMDYKDIICSEIISLPEAIVRYIT